MKTAHAEWAATRHRPGRTFALCLRAAWAAERQRVQGREHYNPDQYWTPQEVAFLFVEAGRQMRAMLGATV